MSARQDIAELQTRLNRAGIAADWNQTELLRRASMTLHRWHERECGDDHGCIERDEETSRTYWLNSMSMKRYRIPDRETPAVKRIAATCKALGAHFYVQGDPRGCALYVSAEPITDSDYNRGVAVY